MAMAQKYLFIAILCVKMSRVNKAYRYRAKKDFSVIFLEVAEVVVEIFDNNI